MTVNQFRKKCDVARQYGETELDNGSTLHYHGPQHGWSIHSKNGNTISTSYNPKNFEYLFDPDWKAYK